MEQRTCGGRGMLELGNPREEGTSLTGVQSQVYADGRSDWEPSPEAGWW